MRKCLVIAVETMHDEVVPASALQHVIHSNLFCPDSEVFQNVFATLFKLPNVNHLHNVTKVILSKFEILLLHEVTPLSTNANQQYYSGFHGFLEWCVFTNATTATFATGFTSIIAAASRLYGIDFNMNQFCTLENILLICRTQPIVSSPRVPLEFFSAEKNGIILRMLQYYEGHMDHLIFPMNTSNWEGCNAFFYVTNPEIMKFLFSKGVNPSQKDENGETAMFFIMKRVCQDCILFEHTQGQADELYSCISQFLSYRVGLDEKSLAAASSLIKTLALHRPVFQRLANLFAGVCLRAAEHRN